MSQVDEKRCFVCERFLEGEIKHASNNVLRGICCHCYEIIILQRCGCMATSLDMRDPIVILDYCESCEHFIIKSRCFVRRRLLAIQELGLLNLSKELRYKIDRKRRVHEKMGVFFG